MDDTRRPSPAVVRSALDGLAREIGRVAAEIAQAQRAQERGDAA